MTAAAEAEVIKFPTKTRLVCSSCGAPGEGSCRCGAPYVTPGERAASAVKANPEKSDRSIAEEIGVDHKTVSKARKKTVGDHSPPEKRKGKDGKHYTAKRKPRKPNKSDQEDRAREIVRPLVATGEALCWVELEKQHGIGHGTLQKAARIETILLNETFDPDSLSRTANEKLEIAKRAMQRKLEAEHAMRMKRLDDEVRERVLALNKEYLDRLNAKEEKADRTIAIYQEWTNNRKPLFTTDQFRTILMCLHPDGQRTADKLADAFRLFNGKKFQLTGEK